MIALIVSMFCLLLMGPSSIFGPKAFSDLNQLWVNLVAISIFGAMGSLALIPTFQNMLDAAEFVLLVSLIR